ncbi:MAG: MBL fold metallo-hydrolase [Candidatus Acidiferrales bacterium]
MAFEIDFLPVGEGERGGDAIALRFGNLANPNEQTVIVLDGGTKKSGAELVEHIKTQYKTTVVDAVVCTHSDADHASGLTEVLENLTVRNLFMHLPWNHVQDLEDQLKKASATDTVRQHFRKSLESARELERLAKRKGIPIVEPFSDTLRAGTLTVLGPSTHFYEGLLESFRCAGELALKERPFFDKIFAEAGKAIKWLTETWSSETLVEPDGDASSAENNSSVVLLFSEGDRKFLFTSDAGVPALTEAANYALRVGVDLKTVNGIQIPHHGSKRNVGPAILDRIVGPKLKEENVTKSVIVSAPKDGAPKHPSKRVINAFMRRGGKVIATQGMTILHRSYDAPDRGWANAVALPFYDRVEE